MMFTLLHQTRLLNTTSIAIVLIKSTNCFYNELMNTIQWMVYSLGYRVYGVFRDIQLIKFILDGLCGIG